MRLGYSIASAYDTGWCVPASPDADMGSVIEAIACFRMSNTQLPGTCGGYQHAMVEYARNVLGHTLADITEIDPDCAMPLVSGLICALTDVEDPVIAETGGGIVAFCGSEPLSET